MTTASDIRRQLHRIINSAEIALIRLDPASHNLALNAADGYPPKASGVDTTRGTAELTPTEGATDNRLGDIWAPIDEHRVNKLDDDDPDRPRYRPGPAALLDDLDDYYGAAYHSLELGHLTLTKAGISPSHHLHCPGINSAGCDNWADMSRTDRHCDQCARTIDSNARRLRRHRAARRMEDPA